MFLRVLWSRSGFRVAKRLAVDRFTVLINFAQYAPAAEALVREIERAAGVPCQSGQRLD